MNYQMIYATDVLIPAKLVIIMEIVIAIVTLKNFIHVCLAEQQLIEYQVIQLLVNVLMDIMI